MASQNFTGVGTSLKKRDKVFKVMQLWDASNWDGFFMPRTGAFILRVPSSIHEINSGIFSTEQIKGVATRHVAGGVYPLLHYTAHTPAITSISASSGQITIEWLHHKSGTTYNIYTSLKDPEEYPENTFRIVASGIATVSSGTNSYTFTATQSGVDNYVWVKAISPDSNNTMPSVYEVIKYAKIYVPA